MRISKAGMGVLLAGVMAAAMISNAPAEAKKQPREEDSSISLSDNFRLAARQAQAAMAGGDLTSAAAQVGSLSSLAVSSDEKYAAGELQLQLAARRQDAQAQRKALTVILDSNGAPAEDLPYLRYLAGYFSYYLGDFTDAIAQVTYARQLGYTNLNSTLLLADSYLKKGKPAEGLPLLDQAFAMQQQSGKAVAAPWFDRAAAVSYKAGDWANVAKWYQQKLMLYPAAPNWRTALANYLAAPGLDQEIQLDLYRLEAATGALASERDFAAYASLAAGNGYYPEAKAIIEAGRKSGDLAATEPVTAKLMALVTAKAGKALVALPVAAKKAAASKTGAAAAAAGDAYYSAGQYVQSAEQYRLALSKGGVDAAKFNTRLGIALARSGDLPGGRTALEQVTGPWASTANFWHVWIDQQAKKTATARPEVSAAG